MQGDAQRVVHRAVQGPREPPGADHRAGPVRIPYHGRRHRANIVRVHHVRGDARGRARQPSVAGVRVLRAGRRAAVHRALGPRGTPAANDHIVRVVFRVRRGHIRVLLCGPVHRVRRHRVRMAVRVGHRRAVRLAHPGPGLAAVHHQLRAVPVQHPVHSERDQHHHAHHRLVPGAQDIPRARRRRRHVPQLSNIVRVQPHFYRLLLPVAAGNQGQNVRYHTSPAAKNRRFVLNRRRRESESHFIIITI